MATWRQKKELEELKRDDPAKYARLMAARESARGAMGLFDKNLNSLNAGLGGAPPAASVPVEDSEEEEEEYIPPQRRRRMEQQRAASAAAAGGGGGQPTAKRGLPSGLMFGGDDADPQPTAAAAPRGLPFGTAFDGFGDAFSGAEAEAEAEEDAPAAAEPPADAAAVPGLAEDKAAKHARLTARLQELKARKKSLEASKASAQATPATQSVASQRAARQAAAAAPAASAGGTATGKARTTKAKGSKAKGKGKATKTATGKAKTATSSSGTKATKRTTAGTAAAGGRVTSGTSVTVRAKGKGKKPPSRKASAAKLSSRQSSTSSIMSPVEGQVIDLVTMGARQKKKAAANAAAAASASPPRAAAKPSDAEVGSPFQQGGDSNGHAEAADGGSTIAPIWNPFGPDDGQPSMAVQNAFGAAGAKKSHTRASSWNPFDGSAPPTGGAAHTRTQSVDARLEEARKAALQASQQFDTEINQFEQQSKREELAARERLVEEQHEAQLDEEARCLQEQREAAFQRREEAKRQRQAAQQQAAAQGPEGHVGTFQSSSVVQEFDDAMSLFSTQPEVRRRNRGAGGVAVPRRADSIAVYDSDEDVLEGNQMLAEVAGLIRSEFAAYGESEDSDSDFADSDFDEDDVVDRYAKELRLSVRRKLGSVNTSLDLFQTRTTDLSPEATKIDVGMTSVEMCLRMLPELRQRGLMECGKDVAKIRAVESRIVEMRKKFTAKLQEANERLSRLGAVVHDLNDFAGAKTVQGNVSPSVARRRTVAQMLTVDDEGDDANFAIMAKMGLFSKSSVPDKKAAAAPKRSSTARARPKGSLFKAREEWDKQTQEVTPDTENLEELLEELDQAHKETQATVSDPIAWTTSAGAEFSDYLVVFETDETYFPETYAEQRRSFEEFVWLRMQLARTPSFHLQLPPYGDGEPTLEGLGSFLTEIGRDIRYQTHPSFVDFIFKEDLETNADRPTSFSTKLDEFSRAELAALPVPHLKAIAAHEGVPVARCQTPFEYADRILAKLAGEDPEEAVPLAPLTGEGEGFRGISKVEDDMFDDLASTRVDNPSSGSAPAATLAPVPAQPQQMLTGLNVVDSDSDSDYAEVTANAVVSIPVKIRTFLEDYFIAVDYEETFVSNGYDDIRVVTNMRDEELEELGIPVEDRQALLKAGLDWQSKAKTSGVLDNWAREVHRAGDKGVIVREAMVSADRKKKFRSKDPSMSTLNADGEPEYVMRDKDGNIDYKLGDEEVKMGWANVQDYDPTPVIKSLYDDPKPTEEEIAVEHAAAAATATSMEGWLEKLPKNARKPSLIARWQRRYFKARDGELFYYEDHRDARVHGFIRLRGSDIRYKGGCLLEVFEPRKRQYLVLKAGSTAELEDWKTAFDKESQSVKRRKRRPSKGDLNVDAKTALIFDIGTSSIRAGFALKEAWPTLYMPTVLALNKEDRDRRFVGGDALAPEVRALSNIRYPMQAKEGLSTTTLDLEGLETIYLDLYRRLKCDPADRPVVLTEPQFLTDKDRGRIAEVMFETIGVPSLFMKQQPILSFYSYGAPSGIIVDIGERIDVLAIDQGSLIENGTTKLRWGGQQITEQMTRMLSEHGHRFFSKTEEFIGRLVKERTAYVAPSYMEACDEEEKGNVEAGIVDARRFAVPDGTRSFKVGGAMFRSTEGLFQPHMWGKDSVGIHEVVAKAIQAADIHERKMLCRNIYLSGGTTCTRGFKERLQVEVQRLVPASSTVTVHQDVHARHAAYRGSSVVANLHAFDQMSVWTDDWNEIGPDILLQKFADDTIGAEFSSDESSDEEAFQSGDGGAYTDDDTGSAAAYSDDGADAEEDDGWT